MNTSRIGFALGVTLASISVGAQADTFAAVTHGTTCAVASWDRTQVNCTYKVGKDLEFEIGGVGRSEAGILFIRSNPDGDYYAKFGIHHGCVGVNVRTSLDYVFVSPRDGRVYQTWEECQAVTRVNY